MDKQHLEELLHSDEELKEFMTSLHPIVKEIDLLTMVGAGRCNRSNNGIRATIIDQSVTPASKFSTIRYFRYRLSYSSYGSNEPWERVVTLPVIDSLGENPFQTELTAAEEKAIKHENWQAERSTNATHARERNERAELARLKEKYES